MLSDGRVVYFAPDLRAKTERGLSNDDAWAEYAIHAVTSSGGKIDGKDYNERLFNRTKAASIWRIENVLKAEHCALENTPNRVNRIAFYGKDDSGRTMRIVTKLDDAGNIYADLSEVTVLTGIQKNKIPPLLPLGEVVKTAWERGVVPTVNDNNISKYSAVGNGVAKMSVGRLYTGSAADYEKPSLLKVSTGEGSQVYGWGLYASTERGVADKYAGNANAGAWKNDKFIDLELDNTSIGCKRVTKSTL